MLSSLIIHTESPVRKYNKIESAQKVDLSFDMSKFR